MYPQVFGKYVLERELARGGMARVVLATLRGAGGFEKRLVVKQIRDELACDDEFVRRFVDEAKTTVSLAHPNIVPVYELGVERGTYFLAMEWVQGASVAELLRASAPGGLSVEEGAYIGVEVCRALDYAHRRMNLVHRDVTPRNVMVDEEGQIKVIDFGIAAPVATAPSGQGVFGSPGHMPPEQMEGKQLSATADVFAVAVLLMEVWSGKALFRRRTTSEIEVAMRAPHPKPSDVDPKLLPLDDVIESALSLDAAARPQQADDLARALRRFLGGVDLGDLARQLGECVRKARSLPGAPPVADGPILQRPPSRPTAIPIGTATFAARDEVREAMDDSQIQASTRRTESTAPPAVMLAEPAATRAIETNSGSPRPGSPPARRGWIAGVAMGLGATALLALVGLRGLTARSSVDSVDPSSERRIAPDSPAVAPPPSASGTPSVASASGAPADVAPAARPPVGASSPSAAPSLAVTQAVAEPGQLVLLGNGTTVQVDGVIRGPCPAHVPVDPGVHVVRFSFPATGETKSQTLSLHAGERATLRADFTGATPTIRVARE